MGKTDFQEFVDAAICRMAEEGASAKQIKNYRVTGFGGIRRYFCAIGQNSYSAEMIDAFVLKTRDDWEHGSISSWKWHLVRRGGELLKHFHENGDLGLPNCAQWGIVHDRLRILPSAKEIDDKNNIFALVWNTKRALEQTNYSTRTLEHYQREGFDRILRYFIFKRKTSYSAELVSEIVEQAEADCAGKRSEFCTLRRACNFLTEFRETERLNSCHVQQFVVRDNLDSVDDPNIRELMEKVLQKMECSGAKPKMLRNYRTTGFGGLVRHCERISQPQYAEETIDCFVKLTRADFESGNISNHTWTLVRRGCELLKHYYKTGAIEMDDLRPWDPVLRRPRQSVELDTPTPAQLADPDNIFALSWRVRQELHKKGLTTKTIRHYTNEGLSVIIRQHNARGTECYNESITAEMVAERRGKYEHGLTARSSYQNLRKASFLLSEMHRTGEITLSQVPDWGQREPSPEFASLLQHFCENANRTGIIAQSTIKTARSAIRIFFFELEARGKQSFDGITLAEISNIITHVAKRYTGGLHSAIFCVRIFLKHLFESNLTSENLSLAVPEMTARRKIFREGFTDDEIRCLLEYPDTETAIGKRDHAIMLLAAQTGLRACDVVNLKRGDIDWRAKEIRIVQQKTGKPLSLPLAPESGNAIADYLLNARPKSDLSYIFLCHTGMLRPINNRSASAIVTKHLRRAEIFSSIPRRGFHSFRRSFGTRLLKSEISLELLRQLLGHSKIDSAKPYLSVDEQGLKSCALGLVAIGKVGDLA